MLHMDSQKLQRSKTLIVYGWKKFSIVFLEHHALFSSSFGFRFAEMNEVFKHFIKKKNRLMLDPYKFDSASVHLLSSNKILDSFIKWAEFV